MKWKRINCPLALQKWISLSLMAPPSDELEDGSFLRAQRKCDASGCALKWTRLCNVIVCESCERRNCKQHLRIRGYNVILQFLLLRRPRRFRVWERRML